MAGSVPPGQAVGGQGAVVQGEGGSQPGGAQALRLAANTLQSSKKLPWVHSSGGSRGAVGEGQGGDGHGAQPARLVAYLAAEARLEAYVAKGLQEYEQQHHERQLRSLKAANAARPRLRVDGTPGG